MQVRRTVACVVGLFVLAACGTSTAVVESGGSAGTPYAGPMHLRVDYDDYATVSERSGAAARALECDTDSYDGGGASYSSGLASVQDTATEALENYFAEEPFLTLPDRGYRIEREDDGHTLFSYDVQGRTKIAFIAADHVRDFNDDRGWGIEAWAECDPAELPNAVTDAMGVQVWQDRTGRRAPVAKIRSRQGSEHCDWQDITFLSMGPEGDGTQFLRDTRGELREFLRTTFDAHATLPDDAKDTGYQRSDRHLWIDRRGIAVYLVAVSNPGNVERWPATKERVACA
jgi:hypothetical protein